MRPGHPDKEIEAALVEIEAMGWCVEKRSGRGHAWGVIKCPQNDDDCRCGQFCMISVWSTPRNPGNHANQLKRRVEGCIHLR